MIFVGKITGAVLGFKLATWLQGDTLTALVVGALFGHVVDAIVQAKINRWRAEKYWKQQAAAEANRTFFQSLFAMLGKLVVADGGVSEEEKAAVNKIIVDYLKLPRRARKEAIQLFRMGQVSATSFQYEAARFYEVFKDQQASLENVLGMLFTVATSDGKLKVSEEQMIRSAALLFNYPEASYLALRRRFTNGDSGYSSEQSRQSYGQQSSSNGSSGGSSTRGGGGTYGGGSSGSRSSSYEVLGCLPSDPETVIKQRYRKLVSDFHPDKIVSKDLPDEFMKFANEKFKSIQQAYESIKAERGFN